ncbi:MAG: hypothetical protein Q4F69_02600 [Bacteroidia bacterium]|nr:hypothetical protein [Bacteroidia bacterium]
MTTNDFIQKPTGNETYALNKVPAFIVSTNVPVRASVRVDGQSNPFYVATYSPDFSGRVTVDFGDLYGDCIGTVLPQSDDYTQQGYRKLFHVNIIETSGEFAQGYTGVSFQYYVAATRLKSPTAFSTWCLNHFLTNQPIEKVTTHEAVEWLTFFSPGEKRTLKVRFYSKSGTSYDYVVKSTNTAGCHTENVSYSRVIKNNLFIPGTMLGYYDLILMDDDMHELAVQRYIYSEYSGLEKYFCFVNQLGGIDTLICRGANTLQPEMTHSVGRFGGRYLPVDDTEDVREWGQNSGMMPYRQRDWIWELLSAKKDACKYEPSDKSFNDIVVKSSEISMSDDDQLASCSFTYIYRDESGGVNTQGGHGYLHNSSVIKHEEMKDLTENVELGVEDDVTQSVTVNATKVFVEYTTRGASLSRYDPVYYYIGDATEPSGSFTPGEQDSMVIEIEEGQSIRFSTENSDIAKITVKYYK